MKFASTVTLLAAGLLILVLGVDSCHIAETSLGVDPRDAAATEVKVDFYKCKPGKKFQPLVVFACGGGVPKDAYGSFAEGLSENGYIVAVIEHLVKLRPTAPAQNFVNAVDIQNTIAFAEDQVEAGLLNANLTQIVLMGHSFGFGTVLNALNQVCPFPFCKDPSVPSPSNVTVPLHPGVVMGSAYGASLKDQSGGFSTLKNVGGVPVAIINGAGDINFFSVVAGENLTQGTFDRLNPTKIIATIENLDHFSISEVVTSPNRGDILSSLPREEQIEHVVDAMSFLLKKGLKDYPGDKFCKQIGRQGFNMTDCLEEHM